jgi:hypothetical protein
MYTSGIHAGIQTAHVIHEMMRKYQLRLEKGDVNPGDGIKYLTMIEWADSHKTIIVKSAGMHSQLVSLYSELKPYSAYFGLPMCRWRESKEALNHAQTAVCIVVPKEIYGFNGDGVSLQWPQNSFNNERTEKIFALKNIIDSYRMAS